MTSFAEGTRRLQEKVGEGKIVGRVSFSPDKIAVPQHRGTWASGPLAGVKIEHWTTPGTGPDYLSGPLLENGERYFATIARHVLDSGPRVGMEEAARELLADAQRRIPRKTGELAESGEVQVLEEFENAAVR